PKDRAATQPGGRDRTDRYALGYGKPPFSLEL
ncbi:uncharacterized protein METZ01_LOCUS182052, partial [marine metagenome]